MPGYADAACRADWKITTTPSTDAPRLVTAHSRVNALCYSKNPACLLRRHRPAARLNQAGVDDARGFSLNTANFFTTDDEIGYGEAISGLTNGSHYVIDTSRNGAGPAPDSALDWCNPSGRALGTPPTAATAGAHADAYLWIKRPGESDGTCDRGEPQAGNFV